MGYVEDHLLPGEQIVHRAHLHKIIFLLPGAIATAAAAAVGVLVYNGGTVWALPALALGCLPLLWTWIGYRTSEFAVTDKRVIAKVGWVQRRTLETMLGKVEGVGVDQSITARILNYGTITVTGTGGTQEHFANIASPLEFRRQVQAQISAADALRAMPAAAPVAVPPVAVPPAGVPVREERDCPYCAERILVRARVCKHCGRDVEPLVTG